MHRKFEATCKFSENKKRNIASKIRHYFILRQKFDAIFASRCSASNIFDAKQKYVAPNTYFWRKFLTQFDRFLVVTRSYGWGLPSERSRPLQYISSARLWSSILWDSRAEHRAVQFSPPKKKQTEPNGRNFTTEPKRSCLRTIVELHRIFRGGFSSGLVWALGPNYIGFYN